MLQTLYISGRILLTMHITSTIILSQIDWFLIIGPFVVFGILEMISGGGGGFGGSDDGFGGF